SDISCAFNYINGIDGYDGVTMDMNNVFYAFNGVEINNKRIDIIDKITGDVSLHYQFPIGTLHLNGIATEDGNIFYITDNPTLGEDIYRLDVSNDTFINLGNYAPPGGGTTDLTFFNGELYASIRSGNPFVRNIIKINPSNPSL